MSNFAIARGSVEEYNWFINTYPEDYGSYSTKTLTDWYRWWYQWYNGNTNYTETNQSTGGGSGDDGGSGDGGDGGGQPYVALGSGFGPREVESTEVSKGTLFVSPIGNGDTCSVDSPCSLDSAVNKLKAGDTLFLRGGDYKRTKQLTINVSGTASKPIIIESYPGETAVFDGQIYQPTDVWNKPRFSGIRLSGSYIQVRKVEIKNMALTGVYLRGSHNLVEGTKIHDNYVSGVTGYGGDWHGTQANFDSGYNTIQDNIIYNNSDAELSGGNAYANGDSSDGIAISSGYFYNINHNLVYGNSDDGIDTWRSNDAQIAYNVVYGQGKGPKGNGNGIKTGGNLDPNSLNGRRAYVHHNIVYGNKSRGIDWNSGKDVRFEYNTSYGNGSVGFSSDNSTKVTNNIEANNGGQTLVHTGHSNNSWQTSGNVEFISTDASSSDYLKPKPGTPFEGMGAYAGE